MVRQVIWSLRAQKDKKEILEYWIKRNKSKSYSIKLNELFKESTKIISDYPQIGKLTNEKNVRVKIVRDYLLFYEVTENHIFVLTIWDSRQDPDKLQVISV